MYLRQLAYTLLKKMAQQKQWRILNSVSITQRKTTSAAAPITLRSFDLLLSIFLHYPPLAFCIWFSVLSNRLVFSQNFPFLILVYQWGALVYSGGVVLLFFILAFFCFFVHSNCAMAGGLLLALIIVDILCKYSTSAPSTITQNVTLN